MPLETDATAIARSSLADRARDPGRRCARLLGLPQRDVDERFQESLPRRSRLLGNGDARHSRRATVSADDPRPPGAARGASDRSGRGHLGRIEPGGDGGAARRDQALVRPIAPGAGAALAGGADLHPGRVRAWPERSDQPVLGDPRPCRRPDVEARDRRGAHRPCRADQGVARRVLGRPRRPSANRRCGGRGPRDRRRRVRPAHGLRRLGAGRAERSGVGRDSARAGGAVGIGDDPRLLAPGEQRGPSGRAGAHVRRPRSDLDPKCRLPRSSARFR